MACEHCGFDIVWGQKYVERTEVHPEDKHKWLPSIAHSLRHIRLVRHADPIVCIQLLREKAEKEKKELDNATNSRNNYRNIASKLAEELEITKLESQIRLDYYTLLYDDWKYLTDILESDGPINWDTMSGGAKYAPYITAFGNAIFRAQVRKHLPTKEEKKESQIASNETLPSA